VVEDRSLLVVEDDTRFAETLASEFSDRGYTVQCVESLADARRADVSQFQYAIVDLRLRNDSGLDVIEDLRQRAPWIRIIVLTGYGSIATAVKATKLGATSYFTKPVDIDEVERALQSDEDEDDEPIPIPEEFPSLYRHEREYIEYVLQECDGNISQAARRLGLHRQSLQRKLRKFSPP
jgi:two-component system response regulator RegA